MPPNFNDVSDPSVVNFEDGPKAASTTSNVDSSSKQPVFVLVISLATLIAYTMIGLIVGVAIVFALRSTLNATNLHIILCVLGFQFLMAQAILSLAPASLMSSLSLKHKRWVHWVLQILGSVLALTGCFVKILDKDIHWNTMHGKFALAAMVFTSVSLVNGLASMYAYELRRIVPGIFSRLSHILFGMAALTFACITLSYGFDKMLFRMWTSNEMADALIAMNTTINIYIIINPCITFFKRLNGQFRK